MIEHPTMSRMVVRWFTSIRNIRTYH